MCGELDDDVHIDAEVLERFLWMAKKLGVEPKPDGAGVPDLSESAGRSTYMDGIFSAGLVRAVTDARNAAQGDRVEAVASQAIAFARLAGFLAGQLPPESDLFRATIEALTDGHSEPRRMAEEERTRQAHHHHHDHHHGERH